MFDVSSLSICRQEVYICLRKQMDCEKEGLSTKFRWQKDHFNMLLILAHLEYHNRRTRIKWQILVLQLQKFEPILPSDDTIDRSDDIIDRADKSNCSYDGVISRLDEIIDRADGISYLLAVLMEIQTMLMKLSDVLMSCNIVGNCWPH